MPFKPLIATLGASAYPKVAKVKLGKRYNERVTSRPSMGSASISLRLMRDTTCASTVFILVMVLPVTSTSLKVAPDFLGRYNVKRFTRFARKEIWSELAA